MRLTEAQIRRIVRESMTAVDLPEWDPRLRAQTKLLMTKAIEGIIADATGEGSFGTAVDRRRQDFESRYGADSRFGIHTPMIGMYPVQYGDGPEEPGEEEEEDLAAAIAAEEDAVIQAQLAQHHVPYQHRRLKERDFTISGSTEKRINLCIVLMKKACEKWSEAAGFPGADVDVVDMHDWIIDTVMGELFRRKKGEVNPQEIADRVSDIALSSLPRVWHNTIRLSLRGQ